MIENTMCTQIEQDLELGHILHLAVQDNYISQTRANQLRETILNDSKKVNALERHIQKIDEWLESYREDTNPELDRKPPMMTDGMWSDIEQQRYEYLGEMLSKLTFIRDYPDKEMSL